MSRRTILSGLEQFDHRRRSLLDEVETLDPARLIVRPVPAKWSILEIVDHLVTAERDVLQNLPDPGQLVARPVRFKHRLRYPLVVVVLGLGIRVPVPTPRMLPRGVPSLAELRCQWDESHQWLRRYIEGVDDTGLQQPVFRHPVTGPLNVRQAILLGTVHVAHHAPQIRRLIRLTH